MILQSCVHITNALVPPIGFLWFVIARLLALDINRLFFLMTSSPPAFKLDPIMIANIELQNLFILGARSIEQAQKNLHGTPKGSYLLRQSSTLSTTADQTTFM